MRKILKSQSVAPDSHDSADQSVSDVFRIGCIFVVGALSDGDGEAGVEL
jgi:hypothetical protein